MSKRTLVTLTVVFLAAAPLSAELKYSTHVEARQAVGGPPANPMFAMMGDILLKALAPGGSLDTVTIVGEKGVRLEQNKETMLLPAGAYELMRPGGDVVVVNPKDKTFWVYPASSFDTNAFLAQLNPTVSIDRPGDSATIIGLKADRLTFKVAMSFAMPDNALSMSMTGEMWVAPQYKTYAAIAAKASPVAALFPELAKASADGLTMRQIMRGEIMGGYELEMVVTKIGEEPAPPGAFEIPAGFKEIPAPPFKIGGGTR